MPGTSANVDLTGRGALVTGAASGIGRACAERLAHAGAAVTMLDLDGDAAKKIADSVGGKAMQVDLSDYAALDALEFEADIEADIVVNNAGLQHVVAVEEFPPERFSQILRIMLEAPFRLVRKALSGMYEKGWGRVVNISSVHGLRASPYKSAYVRTPLVENQISDQAQTHGVPEEEVIEKIMLTETAIKRLVEPEEVAEMAAFLCSPAASFINGASLTMDGGWSAR